MNLNNGRAGVKSSEHKWLKLFLSASIPLMIGIFTVVTTVLQRNLARQERENDKQDALLLRQQAEIQADNLRKETVFATYLNDVSKILLLDNQTGHLIYIRMKTLTSLRQLDSERKSHLLLFLYENELIYRHPQRSISSFLKLNDADFNGIYFKKTTEVRCSFPRLYLHDVYLSNSSFIDCYLDRANFSYSIMYKTQFFKTILIRASFKFALLNKANFSNARFNYADLSGASLVESDFTDARWMASVDFTNTNLTEAIISKEQLGNSTLYNCILPNGTWGPIQTTNLVVNGGFEQNCTANGSNLSLVWHVQPTDGELKVFAYNSTIPEKTSGKCYIRVTAFHTPRKVVYAIQTISIEKFSLLVSVGIARYNASVDLHCSGDQYAVIELRFIDDNGLRSAGVYSPDFISGKQMQTISLSEIVRPDIRSVELLVTFIGNKTSDASPDEDYCICDNVKFSISKS